jgi:hypothetical protein
MPRSIDRKTANTEANCDSLIAIVKVIGIQSINHILQNSLIAIVKVIRIRFTDFRISVRGEFKMRVNIQLFIAFQITPTGIIYPNDNGENLIEYIALCKQSRLYRIR